MLEEVMWRGLIHRRHSDMRMLETKKTQSLNKEIKLAGKNVKREKNVNLTCFPSTDHLISQPLFATSIELLNNTL